MATELAKAYVQIIPSAEGIGGNISDILNKDAAKAGENSGKTFSSSLGGGIKKGLAVVGGAATAAAAGLAVVGKSLVANSKETAAYGDTIDKMSQKVGLSAQAYQEWDYVMKISGTEMSSMTTGLKTLTNKLDDAKGGSKSAQEMFSKLGLSMEELNSMSREEVFSSVINGFQGMADSTERAALANDLFGKSGQELAPLFNTSAEETQKLIDQVNNLGGVMSDDAVKASAAFTDSITTFQTTLAGVKNQVSANFLPALTEITNGFTNLIAGNEGASDQLVAGFSQLGDAIKDALPRVLEGFTTFTGAIAKVAPSIIKTLAEGIMTSLPSLTSSLAQLVPQMVEIFLSLLPQLVDVGMQMLVEIGNGIAQALPDLIPKITEAITGMIQAFIDHLPEVIQCGMDILLALVNGILQALPELIDAIPDLITGLVDALIQATPMLIEGAIKLVMALVQALPEIISALVEAIPEIITGVVNALTDPNNVQMLIEGMIQLFGAVAAAMPQIAMALLEAIPQIVSSIVDGFSDLAPQMQTTLSNTFNTAVQGCNRAFEPLVQFASKSWENIQAVFAKVGAWFQGKFAEAVANVKQAWSGIQEFFAGVWDTIVQVFSNAGERFMEVGANIVNGIKEGIGGSWDKLKSWLEGLVGDLVALAKRILGIASPSKVFAEQVGRWIPAGIAEGIESGIPVLTSAIDDMTGDMVFDSVQTTMDSINNMQYTPAATADNSAYALLAEYLPIIAQGMNVDVTVKQNAQGTFEMVRETNNKLKVATGYHALA